MEFNWKILGIKSNGELITEARYFASAFDKDQTVETEGNWFFREPKLVVPFAEVTENMVIQWIKSEILQDGVNMIEKRLADQLEIKDKETPLPWRPQVFTPEF